MSAIVVKAFNGLKPIAAPNLLENSDAQVAKNVFLNSGAMRPMNEITPAWILHKTAPKTIYRYDPDNNADELHNWLEWQQDTDVMRSPIAQDQWKRLYWTDYPNGPRYAPQTMIMTPAADGSLPGGSYLLGVPKPTTKPTVTSFGQVVVVTTVSRVYCMTNYNAATLKESVPGPTVSIQAADGSPVTFTNLPTSTGGDSGVTKKRLYRKVKNADSTYTFRRIVELPIDETDYTDTTTDAVAITLPALPTSASNAPTGPRYAPTVSAEALPEGAAYTATQRGYAYMIGNGIHGGIAYENSVISPEGTIMADDSQTVTITLTNPNNEGDRYHIYRRDTPQRPTLLYLHTAMRGQEVIPDPIRDTTPNMDANRTYPATNAPVGSRPPAPTLTVNASSSVGPTRRVYMVTFITTSGEESIKSPASGVVEVIDGVTAVALTHSEPAPAGVTKRRLYRQNLVGTGVTVNDANWKMVAENSASATSAVDRIADSAIPGTSYSVAMQGLPPAPTTAPSGRGTIPPSVTPESRVYCYTYVTAYDEEGAPSPSSDVISCDPALPVTLNIPGPPGGPYNITKKRIYRSATGTQATKFMFVGEIDVSVTVFVDDVRTAALGELLETEGWIPPPVGLQGLRLMANGAAVGFVGNSLYFSEPNLPHAWPHEYPIDSVIVAIGVFGQSVAVLTNGYPMLFSGIDPAAMASTKLQLPQACTNKRSVVETGDGVMYASPDGLTMIGQGASLVTQSIMSRVQWQSYNPDSMECYIYNGRVLVTYHNSVGDGMLIIDVSGNSALFTTSDINTAQKFTAGFYAPDYDIQYFAQVNSVGGPGAIVRFDQGQAMMALWRSKKYRLPQEDNFAIAKVLCRSYAPQPSFRVYADGVLQYQRLVPDAKQFRLPSGFKATDWEFEIQCSVECTEVALTTSTAELQAS